MSEERRYTVAEFKELIAHLGNCINDQAMSETIFKEDDMAKEDRRVIISWNDDATPIYKRVKGRDQDEVNDKIVQAYISSGRIWEFMDKPAAGATVTCDLRTYSDRWLERKRKLKQTTKENYKKYLKYILESLGDKEVKDISVEDVQKLLDDHSNLSHKTLKDMKGILHQVLRYAVSDGLIAKNPCDSVDIEIPSDKVTCRDALPIEQFRDILSRLNELDPMDRRYLALIMYTGIRRGEALGLKWTDIDPDTDEIHICRSVTHPQQNQPVISSPKTKAGVRTIPLDKDLKIVLANFSREVFSKNQFIVGGEQPLSLSGFRAMMKRINDKIDMHGATAHTLRHSYLTYAVGETNDFKTIQGISGHADLGTLINRYAHPQEDKVRGLMERVHNRITGAS